MAKKKHTANEYYDFTLKPDLSITFGGKATLKRSEETGIPLEDEAVIAAMEGDVPGREVETERAAIYANTRLQPDLNICFPDLSSLKKRPAIIPLYARYAAAAVILLLISLGAWNLLGPGVTPETEKYELAKLVMIEVQFTTERTMQMDLGSRTADEMQVSAPGRESIKLHNMGTLAYSPIDHIGTPPAIKENFLLYRTPNTQSSTLNPTFYAEAEPKKKGLIGRIFSGLFNKASAPFERSGKNAASTSDDGFLWNVAQLGVKSINVLGDHDYTLVREYNEKGNVKGVIVLDE